MGTNTTPTSPPQITITPASALIDENVQIILSGFAPDLRVALHAHTQDDAEKEWLSQATFITNAEGTLDIGAQRPSTFGIDEAKHTS